MERRQRLSPTRGAMDDHQIRCRACGNCDTDGLEPRAFVRGAGVEHHSSTLGNRASCLRRHRGCSAWPSAPWGPVLNSGPGKRVQRLDLLVAKITREKTSHLAARFAE